jgi:hypothetical protein
MHWFLHNLQILLFILPFAILINTRKKQVLFILLQSKCNYYCYEHHHHCCYQLSPPQHLSKYHTFLQVCKSKLSDKQSETIYVSLNPYTTHYHHTACMVKYSSVMISTTWQLSHYSKYAVIIKLPTTL